MRLKRPSLTVFAAKQTAWQHGTPRSTRHRISRPRHANAYF
jgi:hypothetical protein